MKFYFIEQSQCNCSENDFNVLTIFEKNSLIHELMSLRLLASVSNSAEGVVFVFHFYLSVYISEIDKIRVFSIKMYSIHVFYGYFSMIIVM